MCYAKSYKGEYDLGAKRQFHSNVWVKNGLHFMQNMLCVFASVYFPQLFLYSTHRYYDKEKMHQMAAAQ